jgi:G6PDH family F420-dependent oxidoreductase
VIGAIAASTSHKVTTGVTCPTVRIHPAILAQAAATSQLLLDGRFVFGVGSGEALNEHILGDRWPSVEVRHRMLEEAVEVMRTRWEGGLVNHHGEYYTVENARIYSVPDSPPPIVISAFGPKAADLAARSGDGFVTVQPDKDLLARYRQQGGKGPSIAALKVCWDQDEGRARTLAYDLWPTEALDGQPGVAAAGPFSAGRLAGDRGHGGRGDRLRTRSRTAHQGHHGVPRGRVRRGLRQPDRAGPGGLLRLPGPGTASPPGLDGPAQP